MKLLKVAGPRAARIHGWLRLGRMERVNSIDRPEAPRFLEVAILCNFVIHATAMISMAWVLLPGMPGGSAAGDQARVAYVAAHPWLWRFGWLPWQLTAMADLLLGIALLATPWIPRLPAIATVVITIVAIVPDQVGQFLWITRGVHLAQNSVASGNLTNYLWFEGRIFTMIAAWGCLGYLLGALGWTWCFAAAGTWSRRLSWLSAFTWSTFALSTAAIFAPASIKLVPGLVSAGNALGFVLLQLWLIDVGEHVLQRSRLKQTHGRYAVWRHPRIGVMGIALDWVANSCFLRALGEFVPCTRLRSDITDVIYMNYLVDAGCLVPIMPPELKIQTIGPGGRYAMLTVLAYRHGHLGPGWLGPLRKFLPSPIQSNWRIYVIDPATGRRGVYFFTTTISSTLHALVARLVSEGLPMHVPRRAALECGLGNSLSLFIDPGDSSSPDLHATLQRSDDRQLPALWAACFKDWGEFLSYCVPQNCALSAQPWYRRITRQEIVLNIPLSECHPLAGSVTLRTLREILGRAEPLCFFVPNVAFQLTGEYRTRAAS